MVESLFPRTLGQPREIKQIPDLVSQEIRPMAKKKTTLDGEELDFEQAMVELETIVRRLEQGGGALEQALGDYSNAIGLLKTCHQQLENAERRIEILSGVDAEGNPLVEPLADADTSLEQKRQTRSARRTAEQSSEEGGLF